MRQTPNCRVRLIFEIASLPQQDKERWIGQSWLRRSLMEFLLFRFKARLKGALRGILKPTATPRGNSSNSPSFTEVCRAYVRENEPYEQTDDDPEN